MDTHLHLYPFYDSYQALCTLRRNLSNLSADGMYGAFLAERHDCHIFSDIYEGRFSLPASIQVTRLDEALLVEEENFPALYLFPGRQIITKERIEILALTTDTKIADGQEAANVIDQINDQNGIPVLSWAPGKWFFSRGKLVEQLIDRYEPQSLLLGDTTLRFRGWPEPRLMKKARNRGFKILAGSDPLPFAGEEHVMGEYVANWNGECNLEHLAMSVRAALRDPACSIGCMGKRSSLFCAMRRLYKNAASNK